MPESEEVETKCPEWKLTDWWVYLSECLELENERQKDTLHYPSKYTWSPLLGDWWMTICLFYLWHSMANGASWTLYSTNDTR